MPSRARNLEIKAVHPDPPATLAAARIFGAEDQGFLQQRDEQLIAQGYADLLA